MGRCGCCNRRWDEVKGHTTMIHGTPMGMFPLCEECWAKLSVEERLPFYKALWLRWRNDPHVPRPDDDWDIHELSVRDEAEGRPHLRQIGRTGPARFLPNPVVPKAFWDAANTYDPLADLKRLRDVEAKEPAFLPPTSVPRHPEEVRGGGCRALPHSPGVWQVLGHGDHPLFLGPKVTCIGYVELAIEEAQRHRWERVGRFIRSIPPWPAISRWLVTRRIDREPPL